MLCFVIYLCQLFVGPTSSWGSVFPILCLCWLSVHLNQVWFDFETKLIKILTTLHPDSTAECLWQAGFLWSSHYVHDVILYSACDLSEEIHLYHPVFPIFSFINIHYFHSYFAPYYSNRLWMGNSWPAIAFYSACLNFYEFLVRYLLANLICVICKISRGFMFLTIIDQCF